MRILIVFILMFSIFGKVLAQPLSDKAFYKSLKSSSNRKDSSFKDSSLTIKEKTLFFDKNIPSIIGNTGMTPAFFDNLSVSFGDDKIDISKKIYRSDNKLYSFGGKISASAPNGSRTLFSPSSKSPFDFDGQLKYTIECKGSKWQLLDSNGKLTPIISSVKNQWFNFSFTSGVSKQILFSTDTINTTQNPFVYEFFVSWNGIFNSFEIPRYINGRILWSIGAGYGRYTNYSELDEITLRKGILYNNQLLENETISGRKGDYKQQNGLVLKGALYKPLTSPFALTNAHVGLTLNSLGLGSSNHLLNSTIGIYFSKWKSDDDEDTPGQKILKEIFSVGIIASFKNLQNVSEYHYAKDNFNIVVSAQIPLNFF